MKNRYTKLSESELIDLTAGLAVKEYMNRNYSNYFGQKIDGTVEGANLLAQVIRNIKSSTGSCPSYAQIASYDNPEMLVWALQRAGCQPPLEIYKKLIASYIKAKGCTDSKTIFNYIRTLTSYANIGFNQIDDILIELGCSAASVPVVIDTPGASTDIGLAKALVNTPKATLVSTPETAEMRILLYVKDYGCPKGLFDVRNFVERVRYAKRLTDIEIIDILATVGCKINTTPIIGEVPLPPLGTPTITSTSTNLVPSTGTPTITNINLPPNTGATKTLIRFANTGNRPTSLESDKPKPTLHTGGGGAGGGGAGGDGTGIDPKDENNSMVWVGIGTGLLTVGLLIGLYFLYKKNAKKNKS